MEPILGVLVGGILAFNAFVTPGRAEKEAEKSLRAKFPGATVNVEIEGKRGKDVLNGRFKSVRIEMSNLRIDDFPIQAVMATQATAATGKEAPTPKVSTIGHLQLSVQNLTFGNLAVKSVELSFDDVKYDYNALKKRSEIHLISFTNGKVAMGIEASALVPLVVKRSPGILEPRVELRGNEIIVTGKRELLGASAGISVKGPIVAREQRLDLENAKVEVGGLVLAPLLATPIVKTINPLYEFDEKWPFNLQIGRIEAENNLLQIEAALTAK